MNGANGSTHGVTDSAVSTSVRTRSRARRARSAVPAHRLQLGVGGQVLEGRPGLFEGGVGGPALVGEVAEDLLAGPGPERGGQRALRLEGVHDGGDLLGVVGEAGRAVCAGGLVAPLHDLGDGHGEEQHQRDRDHRDQPGPHVQPAQHVLIRPPATPVGARLLPHVFGGRPGDLEPGGRLSPWTSAGC